MPIEGGVNPYATVSGLPPRQGQRYCGNASLDYKLDDYFHYKSPACEALDIYEINQKRVNFISFSTVFIETLEWGWQPGSQPADFPADCASVGGTSTSGLMDKCVARKAIFAADVEETIVNLNSQYEVVNLGNGADAQSWGSSSEAVSARVPPHDMHLCFANTTCVIYKAGEQPAPRLSLMEMVRLAGIDSLDAPNTDIPAAANGQHPTYRMTGLSLEVRMDYKHFDPTRETFMPWGLEKDIDVTLTVQTKSQRRASRTQCTRSVHSAPCAPCTAHHHRDIAAPSGRARLRSQVNTWASIGPTTWYPSYPTCSTCSYHRVTRYPQDITIEFHPIGHAHKCARRSERLTRCARRSAPAARARCMGRTAHGASCRPLALVMAGSTGRRCSPRS